MIAAKNKPNSTKGFAKSFGCKPSSARTYWDPADFGRDIIEMFFMISLIHDQ